MSCEFPLFLQNWKNGKNNKFLIYVIAFDPIKIYTDWAHQNDRRNLSCVRYINTVGEKMTGNGRKMSNL